MKKKRLRLFAIVILFFMIFSCLSPFIKILSDKNKENINEEKIINLKECCCNADSNIEVLQKELILENDNEEFINNSDLNSYVEDNYVDYYINSNGFKSYMPYDSITLESSLQYKLQDYAYIGNYGIRQLNNRYLIAVGTALNVDIGTYLDLILENEIIIPCIVGDIKDEKHTLNDNITTAKNGCVSEFIVDTEYLNKTVKAMGDMSYCDNSWNSPVKIIRVYDRNFFKEENLIYE